MQLNNLFADYATTLMPVRNAISTGNIQHAEQLLTNPDVGNTNYQLSLVEQGRLAFLNQDYQQSIFWFDKSYQALEKERAKAKLKVSSGLEKVNALVTNDSAIGYQLPPYEQSMMHGYQALNYAFMQNLEAALVEVRRANLVQEAALASYESELLAAKNNLEYVDWQQIDKAISPLNSRIGDVKNGFQNAYTFYLSGILYEASGQANDAYIDYKKALEIFPNNQYLQRDVLRLGSALGMDTDLAIFKQRFDHDNVSIKPNEGQVVVIYEQGLIDAKRSHPVNIPLWTSHNDMRFFNFALPTYNQALLTKLPLSVNFVSHDGQTKQQFQSQEIVRLQALVAKQLKDEMPTIIARQALRVIAKEQLRQKMSREAGDVGNILAGLYGLASEHADTRSWLTLPANVQMIRTILPAGEHTLEFGQTSNIGSAEIKVTAGKITLVMVSDIGQLQQYQVVQL